MKKIILSIASAFLLYITAAAQDHKAEMVQQITEKSQWLYAYAAEKTITLKLSESMWALALGASVNPQGYQTVKRMGKAFADLSDHFGGTVLDKKCGFTVAGDAEKDNRAGCKTAVDGWNGKYTITVNASGVEGSKDGYKMVFGYLSSVAIYLEDGSAALWHHGYVPKTDKLHIIINADNKYKAVAVTWSADGSTVTINAPGDVETAGWDGRIEKGLMAGWKQG